VGNTLRRPIGPPYAHRGRYFKISAFQGRQKGPHVEEGKGNTKNKQLKVVYARKTLWRSAWRGPGVPWFNFTEGPMKEG